MSAVVPLSTLSAQEWGTIHSLDGGRGFVSRLVSLGFTPGAPVLIVQNFGRGPIIVLVRSCRIALGRGEASKVMVQREENGHGPVAE